MRVGVRRTRCAWAGRAPSRSPGSRTCQPDCSWTQRRGLSSPRTVHGPNTLGARGLPGPIVRGPGRGRCPILRPRLPFRSSTTADIEVCAGAAPARLRTQSFFPSSGGPPLLTRNRAASPTARHPINFVCLPPPRSSHEARVYGSSGVSWTAVSDARLLIVHRQECISPRLLGLCGCRGTRAARARLGFPRPPHSGA